MTASEWREEGEPREIGDRRILYLRHGANTEGAHRIEWDHRYVTVYPMPDITTRKRSSIIVAAVREATTFQWLIGELVYRGLVNIDVNGVPVQQQNGGTGKWRIILGDDGTIEGRYLPS